MKKITQNSKISLIASVLLATAFPYALFTAGVTKETFASPLYIALILVFLLKHNWKTTLLFSTVSVALVLTHHLTAFLTVGVLASITVASYFSKNKQQNSTRSNLLFTALLAGSTALYLFVLASPALAASISPSDLLSVGAYQFAAIAAIMYLVRSTNKKSPRRMILECTPILIAVLALLVVATRTPLLPTAPVLPLYYLLFSLPFIIALPLVSFGLSKLYRKKSALLIPIFWLLPILAFAAYGIFSNNIGGLAFAIRSINFLLPPLTILIAIGIYKLYRTQKHPKIGKLTKILAIAVIVSMAVINVNSVYATVSLQEPYLGYFWRYEPSEYQASDWVTANTNNQTVAGDSKVYYLLDGYFDRTVSVTQGLNYLAAEGSPPEILYVYNQMYKNGYVLYQGIPITLPSNWTDKLASYNCIYANSEVTIYAKR